LWRWRLVDRLTRVIPRLRILVVDPHRLTPWTRRRAHIPWISLTMRSAITAIWRLARVYQKETNDLGTR
jgi:hypothetical protein